MQCAAEIRARSSCPVRRCSKGERKGPNKVLYDLTLWHPPEPCGFLPSGGTAVATLRLRQRLVRVDRLRRVLTDQTVDRLTDQVGVTDVPRVLLDNVHE